MARRLATNITNDHLTCPICQDVLSDPRRLPCDHTFCFACLRRMIDTSRVGNKASCPVDREEFRAPFYDASSYHWVDSLPKDDLVISLVQTIHGGAGYSAPSSQGEIPCKVHPGETYSYFCFGCYDFACHECILDSHKKDECNCMTFKKCSEHTKPILRGKMGELVNLVKSVDQMEVDGKVHDRALRSTEKKVVDSIHIIASHVEKFRDSTVAKLISLLSQVENLTISKNKIEKARHLKDKIDAYTRYIEQTQFQSDIISILSCLQNFNKKIQMFTEEVSKLEASDDSVRLQFIPNPEFLNLCQKLKFLDVGSLEVSAAESEEYDESHTTLNGQEVHFDVDVTEKDIITLESLVELSVSDTSAAKSRTVKQSSFSAVAVISHSVFAVDQNNMKLMRFTDRGDPTDTLKLDAAYGMTIIPKTDDLLVTQPGVRKMTRVTTHRGLDIAETIQMKSAYYGVDAIDEKTFVVICVSGGESSSRPTAGSTTAGKAKEKVKKKPESVATYSVKIIDIKGKTLKTISMEAICNPEVYGAPYVKPLKQITVTSTGKIVVSVETKDHTLLSCVSHDGEMCWTYEPIGRPEGVRCSQGTVFVYLGDTKTLMMLTEGGQLRPRCCAKLQHYTQNGHALFIGDKLTAITDLSNTVNLFKLSPSMCL